ncbi:HNH endonuclease [Niallia taxi]|nr:HNH endonuclease [Niallia taxi]
MPEPIFLHPGFADENDVCDMCEKPVIINGCSRMYYYWENPKFKLCSDCLISLYTDTFGDPLKVDTGYKKTKIPEEIKAEIFERDNYSCQYCGADRQLSIDHIRPEVKGGTLLRNNLVTACKRCNSKKGDRTPEEANMKLINDPR